MAEGAIAATIGSGPMVYCTIDVEGNVEDAVTRVLVRVSLSDENNIMISFHVARSSMVRKLGHCIACT